MRFEQYAVISTLVTALLVGHAYTTRLQFYPAVIYLVTSKPSIMVLFNQAFVFTILLGKLTNKIFLGRLREAEREICYENLRYTFTEMCLALSTFREEMSLNVVVMFTGLLFSKVFHWLCEARVEHLEQAQDTSRLAHARTLSLMAVLFVADVCCAWASMFLVQKYGPSVHVFFGFEYALLAIKVVEIFVKYCLAAVDSHFIQGQWYNKSLYELYLKLVIDVAQLFVNIVFFAIIFTYYGVPLHLMRQLYIAVKNVHERLSHFWRFRRITANLHERFPNATEEDLASTDRVCIICREEMVAGSGVGAPKKLSPCGHIFHFYCLRNWLERQLKCPTCRSDISNSRQEPPSIPPRQIDAVQQPPPGQPDQQQQPLAQGPNPQPQQPLAGQQGNLQRPRPGDAAFAPEPQRRIQLPQMGPLNQDRPNQERRNEPPPQAGAPPPPWAGGRQDMPASFPNAHQRMGSGSNTQPQGARLPLPHGGLRPGFIPPPPPIPPGQNLAFGGAMFGFPPPPLGFPMGVPPVDRADGVPLYGSDHELPSVAQFIQSQIDILQLQLQVYQAQVEAANATRRAAVAAMQVKEFHERQRQSDSGSGGSNSPQPSTKPAPAPAPAPTLSSPRSTPPSETDEIAAPLGTPPSGHGLNMDVGDQEPSSVLRRRVAAEAVQRRMLQASEKQNGSSEGNEVNEG